MNVADRIDPHVRDRAPHIVRRDDARPIDALIEQHGPDYRVPTLLRTLSAHCPKRVSVTMYDTSDETYPEPQTFTFAKPYGWRTDLPDDEALLQVWQAVGVQR